MCALHIETKNSTGHCLFFSDHIVTRTLVQSKKHCINNTNNDEFKVPHLRLALSAVGQLSLTPAANRCLLYYITCLQNKLLICAGVIKTLKRLT